MFEPPVSTPISRIQAIAASRIFWYSLSVKVWAGATVMESPVCTPIGSKFSMEQIITTLSFLSRITSSSYSFQPIMDSSIRISEIMLDSRPRRAISSNSSGVYTVPAPVPPRVKEGRIISGKPILAEIFLASFMSRAKPLLGRSRPIFCIACLKSFLSSAFLIALRSAPII